MYIAILFQFNHEDQPAAVSGIEGDVADVLLPAVGDIVRHSDHGQPFEGKVINRIFQYDLPVSQDLDGRINVTLLMDRTIVH